MANYGIWSTPLHLNPTIPLLNIEAALHTANRLTLVMIDETHQQIICGF